jgi:hypothetical protein
LAEELGKPQAIIYCFAQQNTSCTHHIRGSIDEIVVLSDNGRGGQLGRGRNGVRHLKHSSSELKTLRI